MCFVLRCLVFVDIYFFFSSRRRHTRCALVTGVQTCALPILGKALETVGRFAINSTIGAAGVFDVAKKAPINLPYRSNGFANTLGFYGVEPGPYFFLPLVGPTTLRDMVGDGIDLLVRSEEHTSELQSLMRISYAVFCLYKKKQINCTYPYTS